MKDWFPYIETKADELNVQAKKTQHKGLQELNGILYICNKESMSGNFNTCFNTSPVSDEAIELLKKLGYRVFKSDPYLNCNGYPLTFIYWGDEEHPEFNTGSKIIEV